MRLQGPHLAQDPVANLFRSLALSLLIVEPQGSNSQLLMYSDSCLVGVGTDFTVSYMEETVVKGKMHKRETVQEQNTCGFFLFFYSVFSLLGSSDSV